MKKTIDVQVQRTEKQEIEVEFPIYREHDVAERGTDAHYMRVDADGTEYDIHYMVIDREESFELTISKTQFSGSELDYILGRGIYQSKAGTFAEMLARAREFLARFPDSGGESL